MSYMYRYSAVLVSGRLNTHTHATLALILLFPPLPPFERFVFPLSFFRGGSISAVRVVWQPPHALTSFCGGYTNLEVQEKREQHTLSKTQSFFFLAPLALAIN